MKKIIQTLFLVLAVQAVFAQFPCVAYFTSNVNNGAVDLYDQSYNMDTLTQINVTSWLWTVSYGGAIYTDSTQNPTIQVPPGINSIYVCLEITTDIGCVSTYCDTIYLNNLPGTCDAYFFVHPDSILNTYIFYDGSTSGSFFSSVTSWYWTITDAFNNIIFTSSTQNPSFTFSGTGTYEVCLTIATDSGCTSTYCSYEGIYDSINQNCWLNLNPVISHVTTIGGSDGFIELNVTGGAAPYTYDWSTGATSSDIYGLTSGLYTVVVNQADSMCSPTYGTFQIIEPYDSTIIDTLFMPPIDTCLNFIPDTFYVTIVNVNPGLVTVTWIFMGQGQMATITVTYGYNNYGNYLIELTINCDSAKALTTYMTYINITSTFGIAEILPEDLIVYPNPSVDQFRIVLPESIPATEIQIFDYMGRIIYTEKPSDTNETSIDAVAWQSGMYLIRVVYGENQTVTRNLIKQ